jgi:hypothetical protein
MVTNTCTLSYVEGTEVLYSTNTFFIESDAILDTLLCPGPRTLLLPQRLADITSLELRWDVLLFDTLLDRDGQSKPGATAQLVANRARVAAHLHHLSDPGRAPRTAAHGAHLHRPNVQRLREATQPGDRRARPRAATRLVLPPRGAARASRMLLLLLPPPVTVELPSNVFSDLCGAAPRLGMAVERREREPIEYSGRVWLRCPVRAVVSDGDGNWAGEDGDGGYFFYIKQGEESCLFWDYEGNAQTMMYTCCMP